MRGDERGKGAVIVRMRSGVLRQARRLILAVGLALPAMWAIMWGLFLYLYAPPAERAGLNAAAMQAFEWHGAEGGQEVGAADDAGCICKRSEMAMVELRVETDPTDFAGHAFIHTPNLTAGFRTDWDGIGLVDYLNPLAGVVAGRLQDDTDHGYDYVRGYRACPSTVRMLEGSIQRHGNDAYQVGDWSGGRNCATWARDRLEESGFRAPEGDCPNRMARQMRPCGNWAVAMRGASGADRERSMRP